MSAPVVNERSSLDAWLDVCLDRFGLAATLELLDGVPRQDRAPPSAGSLLRPGFSALCAWRGGSAANPAGPTSRPTAARGRPGAPRALPARPA